MTVTNGLTNGSEAVNHFDATYALEKYPVAFDLSKLPHASSRPVKVIIAGAGASAIDFAHEVARGALANVDLNIYEKNAGIGGTWFENRYPGCACDIPSHVYQYSWAPNPNWSAYYVGAPEILKYFQNVVNKFNLEKYFTTSRKVVGAKWIEDQQKWQVLSRATDGRHTVRAVLDSNEGEVGDPVVEDCDVFINATGFWNNWRWPKIPGRKNFRGNIVHSADWLTGLSLEGKRVAVIGNGSTGIQVVAAAQKLSKEIKVFVRNPTWITANLGSKFISGSTNHVFTEEEKKSWREDPQKYLQYRKAVELELNSRFIGVIKGTPNQKMAIKVTSEDMKRRLANKPSLQDKLIPNFPVGCRRPTPGTGYLEALCGENCEVIWGELDSFTEKGIRVASGQEFEFDVIICATGFHMDFVPRFPIIGQNGVNLQDTWSKDPLCYMSVIAEAMPNYFVYVGPHAPVGHGSLIPGIERVTLYISDLINKLQTQNYSSLKLKPDMAKAYQFQMLAWLEKTVWGEKCRSGFKNGTIDGRLTAFHGGGRLQYFELLRTRRYEDFEWVSLCPEPQLAFAWLGNGFLNDELVDHGGDTTWVGYGVTRSNPPSRWYLDQPEEILQNNFV